MGGGAWPFLVGGVICLVDSDNERDSTLLTSRRIVTLRWLVCIGEFCLDRVLSRVVMALSLLVLVALRVMAALDL